ncbi:EF-hand calcium-binding domain-containing protein 12 isoform X1 [Ahaetulla prasina]|uniref:EF-hand calcium-binding domain-containing protein 12 isoform X1 n=1 Tax=Ahaetulla prasina TaxID=499056 RepID=UPI002648112E|nr:EF-hand calcium-binding domain-containing protein 12 isoform X1 [Ahaetulla prasina]XP_058024423.1 EF-hand calcium-binding domain-containing protein 12 isoform X1 [Ahaetulla prasina]
MEQFSWLSQSTRNRSDISGNSYISQSLFDSISSFLRENESDSSVIEESPKESASDRILSHCFKQYKLRNEYPYYSLKLRPNRFGPPKSRRRIHIAPPMDSVAPSIHKPRPPVVSEAEKVQELRAPPEAQDSISTEESDLPNMEAWIKERKQLRNLLENCVNLEEWLTEKKPLTQQEGHILRKLKEERQEKEAKIQAELLALQSVKTAPKSEPVKTTPLIRAPYPPSIITLQNLLHKQKLKLVDLFKKADRSRTMKFKRVDFLRIIQETKVPISKTDLEEIIVFLTVSKKGHIITGADLAECQRLWMDNIRDNWKQPKQETLSVAKSASITAKEDIFPHAKSSISSQVASQPKSNHLQVPPINTEPDRRHLTYNQMEIVGKRYKETRRRLKRKTNPLDFAEQCRLVRSGDPIVDSHCLPSSLEGEMGELVDQHRLACHYVYFQCVKLCEKYGIPISERTLKRGLLYPGDRLLRLGKDARKLRQPGGYIDNSIYLGESEGEPFKVEERKPKPIKKPVKKQVRACRWKSFKEFKKMMCKHSKRILPPSDIWNEKFLGENLPESPEEFAKKYMERELRRMYHYLNPLTNPNNFWPGHLLDKLHLYLPESRQDRSEVLFSRVSETHPVNPGINVPHRNWPVNKKGYTTLGDPESRKHNYYI